MLSSELCVAIKNALSRDSPLVEWCKEHYGMAPTIMVGMDDSDPPKETDYPIIVVLGVERLRGEPNREEVYRVSVGVGVMDAEVESTVLDNGVRGQVYTGFLHVEELRDRMESALYSAKILPAETKSASASESYFPLFLSYTEVVFRVLQSTREPLPQR